MKLRGVGPAALKKAALLPGFDKMHPEELAAAIPQIARSLEGGANWQEAQDWAQAQVTAADRYGARILSAVDEEYPALLAATRDDPFIIYVQGALAKPEQRSLAVIGTRGPTQHGAIVARRITTHFGEAGWSIVSGLAIGCDGLAHQAALDCGAHTIAVMAHGLHMTAPSKHKSLAQSILARGGALVSEYPFGQDVQSQQYVKRDRTQAGMALGVVMVQSDLKGGSLYASRAALEYGRWLAVPYPTPRDMENREPKVQANLVIAEAMPHERADLLRCNVAALERVIVLRNKEDYWRLAESNGVEPFTKDEPVSKHSDGLTNDEPSQSAEDKGDFPSRPTPQSETARFEEVANSGSAAPTGGFNAIQRIPADESVAPDITPVAEIGAPLSDAMPIAIDNATVAGEIPTVHALFLAPINELVVTGSLQVAELMEEAQPVKAVHAPVPETAEPRRCIQLEVSLIKHEDVQTAFGLWVPPKIGSKDFKRRLGDSAEDGGVREFYARYRRLHTHLSDLQRKLISVKPPLSNDQLLALRLVSEEVMLHLSKLASASIAIEAQSKTERQRVQKEDWIEQGEAAGQPFEPGKFSANESRNRLITDSSALLNGSLESYVIEGVDSDSGESLSGPETKRLKLSELVECLNSLLISTFHGEFAKTRVNCTADYGQKKGSE